jgi:hypothetical protein
VHSFVTLLYTCFVQFSRHIHAEKKMFPKNLSKNAIYYFYVVADSTSHVDPLLISENYKKKTHYAACAVESLF